MILKVYFSLLGLCLRFAKDRSGATVVEYGLIVGFLSVAIIATLTTIGETIRDDVFGAISTALQESTADE